jgi:hypothetical protein
MIATLQQSLSAVGKMSRFFQTSDGTRLLLLPYGARLLGLYTGDRDENFYWTHPALQRPETAAAVFAGDGWHNTGGDRTWVTPELDIFFPDYPDTRRHWEPPQLDASEYEIIDEPGRIAMSRRMCLRFARAGRDVELELTKWFEPALNPLRREREMASQHTGVQYAGYTQRTILTLVGSSTDQPVATGIWNLIQLPHGGELLVPTYAKATPRVLFGDIPADRLVAEDRLVRFRMDFPGEHKIAVRAAATTGRAGYLRRTADTWSLVIRNFFVEPSGEYVDVPKDDPADFGYAVHAVSVLSSLGDFCELEYHAPALGRYERQTSCTDVSQVWAFRGPAAAIRTVARTLLGADL